jgi:hypothetical protein
MWSVTKYSFNMDTEFETELFDDPLVALDYMDDRPDTKDYFYSMRRV